MRPEQIIIKPLITEKSTQERAQSRYAFCVHPEATKIDIKIALAQLFKVKVRDVNTCGVSGKKRGSWLVPGRTSRWKKAYATLAPGEKIERLEV